MPRRPKPVPKKAGRPALPKGNAKGEMLRIRVTPDTLAALKAKAEISGQTVSEWIRTKLSEAIA